MASPYQVFDRGYAAQFVEVPDDAVSGWLWDGVTATAPPVPQPTMDQIVAAFDTALTDHLDSTAKQKRYDNRITCMVRAGFAGPFQAEGQAFATWCDNCNIMAYQMLAAVQAGTAPMPESPQVFIATLPAMVWPT